MPKSVNKFECVVCHKLISASMFMRHLRSNVLLHKEILDNIEKHRVKLTNEIRYCKHCNKELSQHTFTTNEAMSSMLGIILNSIKKTCSKECKNLPWNTGLTKENNKSLERIAKSRTGKLNPIFKVLNNEDAKNRWIEKCKTSKAPSDEARRGKTLIEFLGLENAKKAKENMSKSARVRKVNGHTGHKHSIETRIKIGEKTAKRLSDNQQKTSLPQKELFEFLNKNLTESLVLEHVVGYYSVDIAIPDIRLAIEVDGDFFHVNENEGFELKYDIQKCNIKNDKRKNEYLVNVGWCVLRFWVSDIKRDITWILKTVRNKISSMKLLA